MQQLEIRFVGTGGAFDVKQGNSSALIQFNEKKFLIDCGHSVFPALREKGIIPQIDYVLITHLHDDHVGSLSTYIYYHSIILQKGKTKIVYPSEAFRKELREFLTFSNPEPDEYVEFIPVEEIAGLGFVDTYGQHVSGMQTFAYYFRDEKRAVYFSGDTGNCRYTFDMIRTLSLPEPLVFHEVSFLKIAYAHTFYKDLEAHCKEFQIYGYHCDPAHAPEDLELPLVADYDHFLL